LGQWFDERFPTLAIYSLNLTLNFFNFITPRCERQVNRFLNSVATPMISESVKVFLGR
jgi:hypothetical protein